MHWDADMSRRLAHRIAVPCLDWRAEKYDGKHAQGCQENRGPGFNGGQSTRFHDRLLLMVLFGQRTELYGIAGN